MFSPHDLIGDDFILLNFTTPTFQIRPLRGVPIIGIINNEKETTLQAYLADRGYKARRRYLLITQSTLTHIFISNSFFHG